AFGSALIGSPRAFGERAAHGREIRGSRGKRRDSGSWGSGFAAIDQRGTSFSSSAILAEVRKSSCEVCRILHRITTRVCAELIGGVRWSCPTSPARNRPGRRIRLSLRGRSGARFRGLRKTAL